MEQAPLIINTGSAGGTNWWLWGTVILVGALAVGGIVFSIWSHQTNANNILSVNENTRNLNQITRDNVLNMDEKITNLETGFQTYGSQITKLESNNIENVKLLSESTLEISTEALIVSIARLVDGFNLLTERVITIESRLDTITGGTPRPSGMFRSPVLNIKNNNDNL